MKPDLISDTAWMDDKTGLEHKIKEMPEEVKLSYLSGLALAQITLEREIERKEEELKDLNKQLVKVSHFNIPQMMGDLGMTGFTLSNGMKVTVRPFYSGKITSDEAYDWLINNNHGDIIKAEVVVACDVSDAAAIKEIAELLEDNDVPFEYQKSVHHMTLGAFIREQDEAGTPVDAKLFNVYNGFKTYIK